MCFDLKGRRINENQWYDIRVYCNYVVVSFVIEEDCY